MFKSYIFALVIFVQSSRNQEGSALQINNRTYAIETDPSHRNINPPVTISNLYNTLTDPESKRPTGDLQNGANVVQVLLEQDNSNPKLFKFDISTIKPGEIKEAELHIYLMESKILQFGSSDSNYYLLRIYQVMPSNDTPILLNPDVHRLLNVHYIPVNLKGWQIFKVKRAIESWGNSTYPNLGFLVTASTIFSQPVEVIFSRRNLQKDETQPNLLIYNEEFTNYNYPDIFEIARNYQPNKINIRNNSQYRHRNCQLEKFHVNFKDIGWNFVTSPLSYPANLCLGRCKNVYNNSTPHAILMKLIAKTSLPHCVPQHLNSINILYLNENNDFILKTVEGLSVESCHCR